MRSQRLEGAMHCGTGWLRWCHTAISCDSCCRCSIASACNGHQRHSIADVPRRLHSHRSTKPSRRGRVTADIASSSAFTSVANTSSPIRPLCQGRPPWPCRFIITLSFLQLPSSQGHAQTQQVLHITSVWLRQKRARESQLTGCSRKRPGSACSAIFAGRPQQRSPPWPYALLPPLLPLQQGLQIDL